MTANRYVGSDDVSTIGSSSQGQPLTTQDSKPDPSKYVLFFDHEITASNPYHLAVLSHWFPSPFTSPSIPHTVFHTAEHWMMYHKARLFDPSLCQRIIDAPTPAEAKKLGREVRGFDREKWNEVADGIVEEGNYLKFVQDDERKRGVVKTEGKRLVECNPDDRIWGIGWSVEEAMNHRDEWGTNRMGDALGRARDRIIRESRKS